MTVMTSHPNLPPSRKCCTSTLYLPGRLTAVRSSQFTVVGKSAGQMIFPFMMRQNGRILRKQRGATRRRMTPPSPAGGGGWGSGGGSLPGRVASPEAVFGFAARFERGHFMVAGVIPTQKLNSGIVVLACVQILEQG